MGNRGEMWRLGMVNIVTTRGFDDIAGEAQIDDEVLTPSSPVISHHVSLSLLSSPDDLSHSRASVPFSWEEEPGKPKQHTLLRAPPKYPKRLDLPPRLLLPREGTKTPLACDHPRYLAALKRWFRLRKDRADDDNDVVGQCSFVVSSENENDMKITRTT
ncbi:hypothetical protein F2Q68_00041897 [Brassica cretica]|uniref:Uncharacterized protein n=1 Tax=Brassica cretica TaxID=69181 RepID=A0A8S9MAM3_BRACR|nr:hypothetical protein F2Q68_00041897 [Brassica cretica]